jgi:hypothetical protein
MDDRQQHNISQAAVKRAPCITFGQFRKVARQREWCLEWLVEQCRTELDRPSNIIRRVLEGARVEGYREGERWVAPYWDDMAGVVLPYRRSIDLYQRATRLKPALAGEKAYECGLGGAAWEATLCEPRMSEEGIEERRD